MTISEDSELTLTEDGYHEDELYCRDDTDRVVVALSEILYIESLGKEAIEQAEDVHKDDGDASSFISDTAESSGSVTITIE